MIKYLKLFLILFGINFICFFGNSVSAKNISQLFPVSIDKTPSNLDQSYDVGILNKARFNTMYLGTVINTMTFDNTFSVFWASQNGVPNLYFINTDMTYYSTIKEGQGFFQYYYSCDKIDVNTTGDFLTGCGNPMFYKPGDKIVTKFLSKIQINTDYVYVYSREGYENHYPIYILDVCFSSSELDSTLCFYGRWNSSYPFSGSLNIPYDYNFLTLRNYASEPPGVFSNIDGGSSVSDNTTLSGNLLYNTCTNGFIISDLERYWRKSDCYAGIVPSLPEGSVVSSGMDFNVLRYMPGTGKTLMEVFTQYRGGNLTQYGDWMNTRGILMYKYRSNDMENPFIGAPVELITLFNNLYNRGFLYPEGVLDPYILLNYCKLKLNSNESNINDPYTGTYFRKRCDKLNINVSSPISSVTTGEVGDVDGDDEVLPPGTDTGGGDGSVTSSGTVISVNWSGTLSGDINKNFEGKTFINDFYQKLQSRFSKPVNNVVGIIPNYILVFMFALILFRFLSH